MGPTRFKTDRRWWFWISLVLFLVPWFLPVWSVKGDMMMPAAIWVILFAYLLEEVDPTGEALGRETHWHGVRNRGLIAANSVPVPPKLIRE